ncbi:hypothetical protein ACHAW5_003127 [Stephanodiscus triporus]|uniref:Nudix hydrolase domain-containing protein n=1 Tax=Stephanodiscus triporus TaxID=2934178 RepID=A0ABD3N3P5_9STRA
MFKRSPLLRPMTARFDEMYDEFRAYKRSISTYGTILLNARATKVVLCRTWKGKFWTLPGGKVNQNESGMDAAARETYEETGFDPMCERGACASLRFRTTGGVDDDDHDHDDHDGADSSSPSSPPWGPLRDSDKLRYTESDTNKRRTCYVCRGVPEDFPFEPVARKEVSEVAWHDLTSLPRQTFAVVPFVGQLKRWIRDDDERRRGIGARDRERPASRPDDGTAPAAAAAAAGGRKASGRDGSRGRKRDGSRGKRPRGGSHGSRGGGGGGGSRAASRDGSAGRVASATDPLVLSALASPGESNRWTEDDMFATNERLLGRKIVYDGNPHDFAERGSSDAHAFRVVGGTFMNSSVGGMLSAPPEASMLQPLMNAADAGADNNGVGLTPFFTDDGRAPWEETHAVVSDMTTKHVSPPPVRSATSSGQSNSKGLALLNRLRQGGSANQEVERIVPPSCASNHTDNSSELKSATELMSSEKALAGSFATLDDLFMTDREITARSQKEKLAIIPPPILREPPAETISEPSNAAWTQSPFVQQVDDIDQPNDHMAWMKMWAQQLPQSQPTNVFGDFRLDVDAIINAMTTATQS